MKLSTRIMAALVLGVVAGLLLGADVDCPLRRYFYEHD